MDQKWKHYDLGWLKRIAVVLGVLLIVSAIVLAIVTPVVKSAEQTANIDTYRYQALLSATPAQYSQAMKQYSRALTNAGMTSGTAVPFIYGPHDNMAFKLERYAALAQRADALVNLNPASTEISTGLADLKATLRVFDPGLYSFWLINQGGLWYQVYWPLILAVLAVGSWMLGYYLPYEFRVRVKIATTPT